MCIIVCGPKVKLPPPILYTSWTMLSLSLLYHRPGWILPPASAERCEHTLPPQHSQRELRVLQALTLHAWRPVLRQRGEKREGLWLCLQRRGEGGTYYYTNKRRGQGRGFNKYTYLIFSWRHFSSFLSFYDEQLLSLPHLRRLLFVCPGYEWVSKWVSEREI